MLSLQQCVWAESHSALVSPDNCAVIDSGWGNKRLKGTIKEIMCSLEINIA